MLSHQIINNDNGNCNDSCCSNYNKTTATANATAMYDNPVWYDIIHASGTARETDKLEKMHRKYGNGGKNWLEPACGTGRFLRILARRGYRMTGIDINQNMLDYAQAGLARRKLHAEVIKCNMVSFCRPGEYDVIFNTINTFRHLLTPDTVCSHFENMAASLRTGGIYIIDIDLANYAYPEPVEEVWFAKRGKCQVQHIMICEPADRHRRLERVINHLIVTTPKQSHYLESAYNLRSYNYKECMHLIHNTRFDIVGVYDFMSRPVVLDEYARDIRLILRVRD